MTIQQDQQDIADAEAALQSMGLAPANFNQALQQLVKRRNAQQDIQKYQSEQFRTDASNLIGQVQNTPANLDKLSTASQFLRTFAEYVATQTQALQGTYSTIKDIVDHIAPMGGNT